MTSLHVHSKQPEPPLGAPAARPDDEACRPGTEEAAPISVFVPMFSSTPDGTITAGLGVRRLLAPNFRDEKTEENWDIRFRRINDRVRNRWVRWACRWLALHAAALWETRSVKIFTSHHSPFFSSGHLVIIHDVTPFRMPRRYVAQTFYTRHFLSTVMKSADAVVTISWHVRDALVELFPEVRRKLVVIPSYSPKVEQPVVDQPQSDRDPGLFMMVGVTRRHKNLDWAADAIEVAAETTPGLALDAVGVWADFWPDVAEAAARPERRSRVRLGGYATDGELDALYRRSRALLYLSTDEGMGLPPLEAMVRGCPVVCSDIPVLREVCGDAAFYVPLRDRSALAGLLGRLARGELDREITRKLALGRERVAAYGAVHLAARWHALMTSYAESRKLPVV